MPTTKVRFVLVSDTHSTSPEDGLFKVPDGDVFIHAGDLTNRGSYVELKKTLGWIERLPHEVKIVIAGNHDLTLDRSFLENQHTGPSSTSQLSDSTSVASLFSSPSLSSNIHYLKHSSVAVTIPSKKTVPIKVFGSPYIPNFDAHQNQNDDLVSSSPTIDCKNGEIINEQHDAHVDGRNMINKQKIKISEFGAFTYNRGPDTEQLWGEIPSDTHVLITHGPAKGRLDDTKVDLQGKSLKAYNHHDESQNPANVGGKSSGSEHEKNVTGLIGRSIGCEVLGRRIAEIKPWLHVCGHVHESRGVERVIWPLEEQAPISSLPPLSSSSPLAPLSPSLAYIQHITTSRSTLSSKPDTSSSTITILPWQDPGLDPAISTTITNNGNDSKSKKVIKPNMRQSLVDVSSRTRMFNFTPLQKSKETVFINASIMKHSWPHGKERNKAIVVDLDVDVDVDVDLDVNG